MWKPYSLISNWQTIYFLRRNVITFFLVLQPCISTEENTNVVDEFESTLNYDEICSSIKIDNVLQNPLMDTSRSEIEEGSSKNYNGIKEEKVIDCALNNAEEGLKVPIFDLQVSNCKLYYIFSITILHFVCSVFRFKSWSRSSAVVYS